MKKKKTREMFDCLSIFRGSTSISLRLCIKYIMKNWTFIDFFFHLNAARTRRYSFDHALPFESVRTQTKVIDPPQNRYISLFIIITFKLHPFGFHYQDEGTKNDR